LAPHGRSEAVAPLRAHDQDRALVAGPLCVPFLSAWRRSAVLEGRLSMIGLGVSLVAAGRND